MRVRAIDLVFTAMYAVTLCSEPKCEGAAAEAVQNSELMLRVVVCPVVV